MSSIPLAIQPPAAPPNPVDQVAKIQGVKAMIQQQQLEQQKIQENQISLNDQKSASDAMHAWDGQNIDDLPGLYIKHGASANAVLALKNNIQDYVSKKATTNVATANAQKVQLENEATMHGNIADGLHAIASLPSGSQSDALDKFKTNPDVINSLTPDQRMQFGESLDAMKQKATQGADISDDLTTTGNQHLAEAQLSQRANDLLTQNLNKQKIATEQQQQATSAAEAGKATAETAKTNLEVDAMKGGNPITQPMADAQYRALQFKKLRGQPLTDDEKAQMGAYENTETLKSRSNFFLNQGGFGSAPNIPPGATGQAALSQMDPKMAAMVKMVGDYKQKSSEITQRMPPAAKANFLSALNAAYPNYDENEFPARSKMLTAFTSGPESHNINAINTAMGHIGVLNDTIDALNNGNIKLLNSIANRFGIETGATPAATFKTIVHRVGPELATAYIAGGGGEGERGTTASDFADSLPPQTLKGNASITATLLRSKVGSLENQWNTTMKPGTPDQQFQARFISPDAKATLDKLSPAGSGGSAGKVLSQTAIAKAAADHGVSIDEATKQAKAAGYAIQ